MLFFEQGPKQSIIPFFVFSGETVFEHGGNGCYFLSDVQSRVLYLSLFSAVKLFSSVVGTDVIFQARSKAEYYTFLCFQQ